ncbi:tetratricopeptide repeat protein [Alcanivorax sp. S6407]|uniref:tetratricopeptide repeat protein n=1 Tax=Alcanivorax sp. S6407 TaxID=2926424 RepID=UPI001FF341A4|nr:tetratricopeptide repeat protein [Alcanivorax sp. S6407]MCK0152331.1 tetratricopeptide repeat protein [Alcanivorax sp. S6407]
MWTSFTDTRRRPQAWLAPLSLSLALFMTGCATNSGSGLEGGPEGHTSRYEGQKAGGAAADSDAIHIPPVPHTEEAEKVAQQAMEEYARALQTRMAGNTQQALVMFQSLAERYPQLSGPWLNVALIRMEQEKFPEAEQAFRKCLAVNDANPYAHNGLGLALREQGKFDEARSHYQQALTLDPKYARAHFNLAVLGELYLQDLNLALTHFRAYQNLQKQADSNVANWIVDLENRAPDAASQPVAGNADGDDTGGVN